jgi:hypothetical protein
MPLTGTTICQAAEAISRKVAEFGIIKDTTYRVWPRETWRGTHEWHIEIGGDIDGQRVKETLIVSSNNRALFVGAIYSDGECLLVGKRHIDDFVAITAVLLVSDFFALPFKQKFVVRTFFTFNRAFAKSTMRVSKRDSYGFGRIPFASLDTVLLRDTKKLSVRLECPEGVPLHAEPIILSDPATASKILNGLVCCLFL